MHHGYKMLCVSTVCQDSGPLNEPTRVDPVIATTWHAKEAVRELYAHGDEATAREWIERLIVDMADS